MKLKSLFTFSLLALLALPAFSVPRFFENTVFISLSESEMQSLMAFVGKSLEQTADQEKTVWRSSETETVGVFKGIASFNYQQKECRRALVALKNGTGTKDIYRLDFCKQESGWKHSPTPLMTLTQKDKDSILERTGFLLENGSIKQPMAWRSEHGNIAGALVLVGEHDGCKEIALSLSDNGRAEINGVYKFCKQDGEWSYAPNQVETKSDE